MSSAWSRTPLIQRHADNPILKASQWPYRANTIFNPGATTLPEARNRGAQNALLAARLRFAQESGCTLAMMCALPGSQSQKNAQKNGFNIAYTRIKWQLF